MLSCPHWERRKTHNLLPSCEKGTTHRHTDTYTHTHTHTHSCPYTFPALSSPNCATLLMSRPSSCLSPLLSFSLSLSLFPPSSLLSPPLFSLFFQSPAHP